MEQKTKFIIIGLAGFCIVFLLLFIFTSSQQQSLVRENSDFKSENATLLSKVGQLENDLRANQGKIDSIKVERDKAVDDLRELQGKYESAAKARDELMAKLKKQRQPEVSVSQAEMFETPGNNDVYWGSILKAKTDLEMQLTNIRTDLKGLQISNESLQRQKSALELDVNSLRIEKKDLLRQLDYNQKLLDSMSQEVVREKNDKIAIQDSLKSLRSENAVLSRQLKSLNSRKATLDEKVQSLQEGKATVEKRLNEMDTMLTDKVSQINYLKKELDVVKSGQSPEAIENKRESVELPAIVVKSSPFSENAVALAFRGKILAINADNNFVVIDVGASNGVNVGDTFNVYRADKPIGSIVVIQARDSISACDIKRSSAPLKINDNIK
ncbi:MAG: hypothetical protein COV71_04905 [Candidatus Omnitrophica bacterium CG11_big_fil_rev_8_21_14_0_20_41_12]|nr:MAG: hypothetical protein COV71_04905 [Candidatus Omnitrophica bacterium CG11_big_fil_rev_8_21_14_0_20_41_12]